MNDQTSRPPPGGLESALYILSVAFDNLVYFFKRQYILAHRPVEGETLDSESSS